MVGQVNSFYFNLFFNIPLKIILAWTTAAVDPDRVIAAIPIVMDILSMRKVNNLYSSIQSNS